MIPVIANSPEQYTKWVKASGGSERDFPRVGDVLRDIERGGEAVSLCPLADSTVELLDLNFVTILWPPQVKRLAHKRADEDPDHGLWQPHPQHKGTSWWGGRDARPYAVL